MAAAGAYISYSELFDYNPTREDLLEIVRKLPVLDAALALSRMNLALRFSMQESNRPNFGRLQQALVAGFADDEIFKRLQERFPHVSTDRRPVFVPLSVLNLMRLVLAHSKPQTQLNVNDDPELRFSIGRACLMMNNLLLTTEEEKQIREGSKDDRRLTLMVQMLAPFELANPPVAHHLMLRFEIIYRKLLRDSAVRGRIARECIGFDFEVEFEHLAGVQLERWLFVVFSIYAYFLQGGDAFNPHPEFMLINPAVFPGQSGISKADLEAVLHTITIGSDELSVAMKAESGTDPRFDFVVFRSKPLFACDETRFAPMDIAFILEKLHTGVHWALHDALPKKRRDALFQAWGILFEEYVHWLLQGMTPQQSVKYEARPKWKNGDESFDGILVQNSVMLPLECKGGFLSRTARYSGDKNVFLAELEEKFATGCHQLAWKTKALFTADAENRRELKELDVDHVRAVLPILVLQDQVFRVPFLNWYLNKRFQEELGEFVPRPNVVLRPLTLVNIHELETMVNSSDAVGFDFVYALHHRVVRDHEVLSELQDWLMQFPGYGRQQSARVRKILDEAHKPLFDYLFPGASEA